jgi:hypothetical protein
VTERKGEKRQLYLANGTIIEFVGDNDERIQGLDESIFIYVEED